MTIKSTKRALAIFLAFSLILPFPAFALRDQEIVEKKPEVLSGLEEALRGEPSRPAQLTNTALGLPSSSATRTTAPPAAISPGSAAGMEESEGRFGGRTLEITYRSELLLGNPKRDAEEEEFFQGFATRGWLKPVQDLKNRVRSAAQELPADHPDRKGALERFEKLMWTATLLLLDSDPLEDQPDPLFEPYLQEWVGPLLEASPNAQTLDLLLAASPNLVMFQDAVIARERMLGQISKPGTPTTFPIFQEDPKTGHSWFSLNGSLPTYLEMAAVDRSRWEEAKRYFRLSGSDILVTAPEGSPAGMRAREVFALLTHTGWKGYAPETLALVRIIHPIRKEERESDPTTTGFIRALGYESGSIHVEMERGSLSETAGIVAHEGTHLANRADPRWGRIWAFEVAEKVARLKHPLLGHREKTGEAGLEPPLRLLDELLAYGKGSEAVLWVWDRGPSPFDPKKEAKTVAVLWLVLDKALSGFSLLRSDPNVVLNEDGRGWLAEAETLWGRLEPQIRRRWEQALEALRQGDESDRFTFYSYVGLYIERLGESWLLALQQALEGESLQRLREISLSNRLSFIVGQAVLTVLTSKTMKPEIKAFKAYSEGLHESARTWSSKELRKLAEEAKQRFDKEIEALQAPLKADGNVLPAADTAGLDGVQNFESSSGFLAAYGDLLRKQNLLEAAQALAEQSDHVTTIVGPSPLEFPVKVTAYTHPAWQNAVDAQLKQGSFPSVSFAVVSYPADGLVEQPAIVIREAGAALPAEPDPAVPVIVLLTPADIENLTPGFVYAVAVNKNLAGQVIGPIVGILTFTDEQGRTIHAVFA